MGCCIAKPLQILIQVGGGQGPAAAAASSSFGDFQRKITPSSNAAAKKDHSDLHALLRSSGIELGDVSDLQKDAEIEEAASWSGGAQGVAASATAASGQPGGGGRQGLIVVATLIDKVPNLAGLTRTCEVFKAEALVLGDLKVRSFGGRDLIV